jgi:hypothetical protein
MRNRNTQLRFFMMAHAASAVEKWRTTGQKDKNTRLKFINANHPNFDPKSEGLDPIKILDYIYAKDQNGKVVYGVDAFAWIW